MRVQVARFPRQVGCTWLTTFTHSAAVAADLAAVGALPRTRVLAPGSILGGHTGGHYTTSAPVLLLILYYNTRTLPASLVNRSQKYVDFSHFSSIL